MIDALALSLAFALAVQEPPRAAAVATAPAQARPGAVGIERASAATRSFGPRGADDLLVDTIVELRRGDRVVLENLVGKISVGTWTRDELELREDENVGGLTVRRSGSTVHIERADRKERRRRGAVEAAIRVPAWVDLDASGRSLDLWIAGLEGRISVSNVSGDVWIQDAGGPVDVRTVEGEIDVSRARAGVSASSQSDEVRLRDVSGPVSVHSGSGDVLLMDIVSESVQAETQDGDIEFSGTLSDRGEYGFFVHDGDAVIAIPEGSNARVSVSTFDGDFEAEFPVVIDHFTGGREFDFSIGAGGARVQIQVFDGEIRLLRRR